MKTKVSVSVLLMIYLCVCSGCITHSVVTGKAQPHRDYAKDNKMKTVQVDGRPAYYLLLPLTIAADIVTSPFQLYCYAKYLITGEAPFP